MNIRKLIVMGNTHGKVSAHAAFLLSTLIVSTTLNANIPVVDWLEFSPGTNSGEFDLADDTGASFLTAQVSISSGAQLPFSPSAGFLDGIFWQSSIPYLDSMSGGGSVATTLIQVAPENNLVSYQLILAADDLSNLVFSVGQLFESGSAVEFSAFTESSARVPIRLMDSYVWDNGVRVYSGGISWVQEQQELTSLASSTEESRVAFFEMTSAESPITSLVIDFSGAFNGAVGDQIEFAFGLVPEPSSSSIVLGLCALFVCNQVRRRT